MNRKIYQVLGVSDFRHYLSRFFLPILLFDLLILFLFIFGFTDPVLRAMGVVVFFIVFFMVIAYPLMLIDNQSRNIEENLHYFITYAGALSTINLDRKAFFADLSEKNRYREIANIFKRLVYLVESIKLDFASVAYKISGYVKSDHFSRFLERMGISLSFSSSLSQFFLDEQKVLMNSYANIYKESLERLRMIQEMFVALILSFVFVTSTLLLIPFLTGINAIFFLQFAVLAIIIINVIMVVFAKYFLPKDNLFHNLGPEGGRKTVIASFVVSIILSIVIAVVVIFIDTNQMLKVALIFSPFLITGILATKEEKKVQRRDLLFPAFIRSLGEIHFAKGGTLTSTVETLLPHNFGILNEMLERVYKRLKITYEKFYSWYYFSKESGSALITEFMDIFVSVVYRGGSARIAGQIVSDNMTRINNLRDMKKGFVSTLRGNIYGVYFGLTLTLYISLLIAHLLFQIFSTMTEGLDGLARDLISGVFPSSIEFSLMTSSYYITAILIIQAFAAAFLVKEIDGGSRFAMFTDFVSMLWMGAVIEILVTLLFTNMFSSYF